MNNLESDSMTIDDVYRMFGEASHWANILEVQLCNICMLNERVINQESYKTKPSKSIVTMFEKKTIGVLLESLREVLGKEHESNVDKIFKPALKTRNHLIHVFFISHHDILTDKNKIPSALTELNEVKYTIFQAANIATEICKELTAQYLSSSEIVVNHE